jgi:tetratricopeptide (TPR) repeat protein
MNTLMSKQGLLAVALATALAGCASTGQQARAPDVPAGTAAAPAAAEPATPAETAAPKGPAAQLDGRTVYQVLLAEIAIQRGEAAVAAHAYGDAARRTGDLGILTRAIQIAGAARRYDMALDLTRQWVAIEPDSTHARQSLVGILAALGRGEELESSLRELLAADAAARPRNLMHMTRLFAAEPDRALAMRRVYGLSEPYLDLPEAHYTRAAVAHSAGQREAALTAVRRASALREAWAEPWQLEIQILGPEGAAEATQRVRGYLSRHADDVTMRMQLARLYATQKLWAEARAEFERVAEDSEDGSEALNAVGLIAVQQRDYAAAEEIFGRLLAAGRMEAGPLHHQLGLIAEDRRQFDKALTHLRQVTDGEYRIAAQSRIAIVLAKLGRIDEARAHLHAVPTFNAEERQRLVLAEAQVLREAKDFKGAFEVLSKALERAPDQPDLLYDHAMIAERIQRFDVLEGNLNRLITLDPENAHAYNALGYTLADRNIRLEEARQLILKALDLAPDDVFILDSMGWVLYRLGDVPGALRHLERAWSLRRDPEIAAHLGEVLWAAGRRDEAKKIWREARAENPDNEVLATVIEKFLK